MAGRIVLERGDGFSFSYCGTGSQILAGAFVGAIAGFVVSTVIGRDEKIGAALGALAGAIIVPLIGC